MIKLAGLGVAYHAKSIVAKAAGARIDRGDLTALLYAQGMGRGEWVGLSTSVTRVEGIPRPQPSSRP